MSPAAFIDDPEWANFLPETRESPRRRHLPTHEDCSPLDPDSAAAHLMRGGTLGAMPGYEERPGQLDMLKAIVRAFNAREHLMIEAGTGVGKSLAYLVPAIHWAWLNDTPVIVSTATRNLQSQLVNADIPRALETLGPDAAKFKVALLKGRANYVCLRSVAEFFSGGYWSMSESDQALMPDFIEFLKTTPDGDLDAYDGISRSLVTCPGEECGGRRCRYYSRCFVYRARKAAAEAHLVIANHALVLAEAASGNGAILPPCNRMILDEAHNLEDIATDYFSSEFSVPALNRVLNRLLRKPKGRASSSGTGGVLGSIGRQINKGVLSKSPSAPAIRRDMDKAAVQAVKVVDAAEDLADVCSKLARPGKGKADSSVRYRVEKPTTDLPAPPVRSHSVHGLFKPYPEEDWNENELSLARLRMENEMAVLVNILHDLKASLETAFPEGEINFVADLAVQTGAVADSIVAFANEVNFVLSGEKDTHAYWIERVRVEKRRAYWRLVAAPLSVADDLAKLVYDVKDSVILSSATLRIGNDFRYMASRLGAVERFKALTAASPFDYMRQAAVYACDNLPDPAANPADYAAALSDILKDLFAVTNGRALVLFTSYEMMSAVAAGSRSALESAGIDLLVQGEGLSREAMASRLRRSGNTVLFGAQSFWEGVDIAGEALSLVVIARLPFAMVRDAIVEARCEKIDRGGGSSFRDYMLPEAVIKFRQGFGRLIRTKRDRGVVVVTDPRLVTKNYGAVFRRSIPASVHTVTGRDELISRVQGFFSP